MKSLSLSLIFVLILFGCSSLPWPANLTIQSEYSTRIDRVVNDLNDRLKVIDNTKVGYKITVTSFGLEYPTLGMAMPSKNGCSIIISDTIFESYPGRLKSTVWHEIGHCAGLDHSTNVTDIMYRYAYDWHWYSEEAIQRFIDELNKAIKLEK